MSDRHLLLLILADASESCKLEALVGMSRRILIQKCSLGGDRYVSALAFHLVLEH